MTIEKIKSRVRDNIGNKISITYNGARNKVESYEAIIKEMHNNIFTVVLTTNDEKKSFSYSDILTKTVEIKYDLDFNENSDKIKIDRGNRLC